MRSPTSMGFGQRLVCAAVLLAGVPACGGDAPASEAQPPAATVGMDFAGEAFFDAPFPSDHRLAAGVVDLGGYPRTDGIVIVEQVLSLLDGQAEGFGTTSGVFLTTSAPIDPASLPELETSILDDASVFLIGVDPDAPDYLQPYPITVRFDEDGGPFGAANMLAALPLQGVPLLPEHTYALVVTRRVTTATGAPLARSPQLVELVAGATPAGLDDPASYREAVAALEALGRLDEAVAVAAFTTWDPTRDMYALADYAATQPLPELVEPMALTDVYDDMCVYQGQLSMPVYQSGTPPYTETGGKIEFVDGVPQLVTMEPSRIVVTIPRGAMPPEGWPVAAMIRTGGGGDRPLVDRGTRDASGEPITPGTGPAKHFAEAGFAGVSFDGPHGGPRNVSMGDEQFLVFNIANPEALRDNLRQSAMEFTLLPELMEQLTFAVADCPDAAAPSDTVTFDTDAMALMGHSMGATIAPLVLAAEPRYGAVIFSGAGGSWIENVIHKLQPLAVKPLAEVLVGYPGLGRQLHEHDPFLNLLQWVGEPADPPVYGDRIVSHGTHVLMLQGIVDNYILPPIANATSLALRLDRAGEALDVDHPELSPFRPLDDVLVYRGGEVVSYPVEANRDATAVVVQHAEDPIEDGHETVFQTDPPKFQYRCFLESWLATGTPQVVAPGDLDGPCP